MKTDQAGGSKAGLVRNQIFHDILDKCFPLVYCSWCSNRARIPTGLVTVFQCCYGSVCHKSVLEVSRLLILCSVFYIDYIWFLSQISFSLSTCRVQSFKAGSTWFIFFGFSAIFISWWQLHVSHINLVRLSSFILLCCRRYLRSLSCGVQICSMIFVQKLLCKWTRW